MVARKDLLKYKALMVKSNYIIEASYKLSLQEQRLIYILTTKINRDDKDFKNCRFTQTEINNILSKHKITFNELNQYIDSLRNRELVIIRENSILKTKWLSSAEYFDDGSIELCFDSKLKPYLLQLKDRFTKLSLNRVVTFSSNYSCRIYELLKQYESIGERVISIENLRTMFCIEPNEYKLYGDFKRKVILKAQKEINSNSDISFDFEEIKTGRKVTSIKFYIHSKNNSKDEIASTVDIETAQPNSKVSDAEQVQAIFREKISLMEAQKILDAAGGNISIVRDKYSIVKGMANCNNVVGATIQAIKQDWKPGTKKKLRWNDYDQRQYDIKELEKQLRANYCREEDIIE